MALLSGCQSGPKAPLSSADIPAAAVPAVSGDLPAETLPTEVPEVPEVPETTEATTALCPVTSEVTTDPLNFAFDPFSAKMFATDTLNVREYPSTEAKVVGQLNPGDEVDVVGMTPLGDWYVVNFNGGRACVFGAYLSAQEPEIKEENIVLPEDYRFKSDSDYYFVVNKDNPLPEDYSIVTDFVQGSYELEAVAAKHCKDMIEAAKKDGIDLKVLSAYRTVEYQKNLFDRNVKQRMDDLGMSYDEAVYDVSINIAPPGGSEHNAGLAVDIIDRNHWDTYEEFEDTPEFAWLSEHCAQYGFVLRYPKGKEDLTGYIYEPWHYRYVGLENAASVAASGLCLEELLEV